MRGLASGDEDYEKFPKLLQERFICVNVYCRSQAEEHKPRGPDGPYQFNDRSVPLFVIKRWDGETLQHHLGFASQGGQRQLASWIEKAVKENGAITPPKALKPLIKALDKARAQLEKDRPGAAYKDLLKVVAGGANKKAFPEGPPTVAKEAQALLDEMLETANEAIDEAVDQAEIDREDAVKTLKALARRWNSVKPLKTKIAAALKKLTS